MCESFANHEAVVFTNRDGFWKLAHTTDIRYTWEVRNYHDTQKVLHRARRVTIRTKLVACRKRESYTHPMYRKADFYLCKCRILSQKEEKIMNHSLRESLEKFVIRNGNEIAKNFIKYFPTL